MMVKCIGLLNNQTIMVHSNFTKSIVLKHVELSNNDKILTNKPTNSLNLQTI